MEKKRGGQKNNKNASKNPKEIRTNRSFKASDEEFKIIEQNAINAGMKSVSEYIRHRTILKSDTTDLIIKYKEALNKAKNDEKLKCHILAIQQKIEELVKGATPTTLDIIWVDYLLQQK